MSENKKKRGQGLPDFKPQNKGTYHFLGIGINKYKHWSNLNNAVKDIKDISRLLIESYQFLGHQSILLLDTEASRTNIISELEKLTNPNKVKQEDSVLIYYSGHGSIIERGNQKKRGFWIPVEARHDKSADYLSNSRIHEYIEDIPARHILLISDACFSGSLLVRGAIRSDSSLNDLQFRKSRWGLCSGRADEVVADGPAGGNSPFTKAILEELIRNNEAQLNIQKLAVKIVENTRRNYKQLPEGAPIFGVGDKGGQFIFERELDEDTYWENVKKINSVDSFKAYLVTFPEGKYIIPAQNQVSFHEEAMVWKEAQKEGKLSSFEKYVKDYPKGRYAQKAYSKIQRFEEDALWEKANKSKRPGPYENYLKEFPKGKYAEKAEDALSKFKKKKTLINPTPPTVKSYYQSENNESLQETKEFTDGIMENISGCLGFIFIAIIGFFGIRYYLNQTTKNAINVIESKMVFVEGGTFNMGCDPTSDKGCAEFEGPVRQVTVPGFSISKTELSWHEFTFAGGWRWKNITGPAFEDSPAYMPLEDIHSFINNLNKKTGMKYRLPTEAEWEYAARGGNSSKGYEYAGGNNPNLVAWHLENADSTEAQPVGQKYPNELGLYDMSGNVWEWCLDCFRGRPNYKPASVESLLSDTCTYKVVRGGAGNSSLNNIKITSRSAARKDGLYEQIGFRLVRDE